MSSPLHLSTFTRKDLNSRRLRVRITDEWRQRIGNKAFFRNTFIAPVNRNTDGNRYLCRLLSAREYVWSLPLWLILIRLEETFTVSCPGNAKLIRQRLPDFHKLLWLQNRVQQRVWSSSGSAQSDDRWFRHTELIGFPNASASSLKIRAAGFEITFGCSGLVPTAFQTARSVPERTFRHLIEGKQTSHVPSCCMINGPTPLPGAAL